MVALSGQESVPWQHMLKLMDHLQTVQAAVLDNKNSPAGSNLVKNVLTGYDRENAVSIHGEYKDRSVNTFNNVYTLDESKPISNRLHQLRNRLEFLLDMSFLVAARSSG